MRGCPGRTMSAHACCGCVQGINPVQSGGRVCGRAPSGTRMNGSRSGGRSVKAFERVREWPRALRRDVLALSLAARDPRVPWYAKVVAACVVVYALSPIDLIPDVIPVLGHLDDLVIVPL